MEIAMPVGAEIKPNVSASKAPLTKAPLRDKDLEKLLRDSQLCKNYPDVVKVLPDHTVLIATFADRQLSDKAIKLLAVEIANLILTNVDKTTAVKVRFYDPASIQYWKDIVLSKTEIENGSKSGADQNQVLDSIAILNNLGFVDGPDLATRVDLYKRINKLRYDGIDIKPYQAKLAQIEAARKNGQNEDTQLSALNQAVIAFEPTTNKPVSSELQSNDVENQLKQSWKEACEREANALKVVEDAEQDQRDMALPEARDLDSQARYENNYQGVQRRINKALADWQAARRDRDLTYEKYMRARGNS
jgi:hypothetical protein